MSDKQDNQQAEHVALTAEQQQVLFSHLTYARAIASPASAMYPVHQAGVMQDMNMFFGVNGRYEPVMVSITTGNKITVPWDAIAAIALAHGLHNPDFPTVAAELGVPFEALVAEADAVAKMGVEAVAGASASAAERLGDVLLAHIQSLLRLVATGSEITDAHRQTAASLYEQITAVTHKPDA